MATRKRRLFNLLIDPATDRQLAARAKAAGLSKSELVRRLIIDATLAPPTTFQRALLLVERKFVADGELLAVAQSLSREPTPENFGRSDLEALLGIVESNRRTLLIQPLPKDAEQRRVAEV